MRSNKSTALHMDMDILSYITDKALILVPVLLIIEKVLLQLQFIKDKYIPLILLPIGIGGAIALSGVHTDSVIQGILVTGAAVYTKQIYMGLIKKTGESGTNEQPVKNETNTDESEPQTDVNTNNQESEI